MWRVSHNEFERIIADALLRIPEKFRRRIGNCEITFEDVPSAEQLRENDVPEGDTLLGFFEGLTLGEQGSGPWELPSVITIFKEPSEEEAGSAEELREIVYETLWHEVAHYFGMEEHEVMTVEDRRRGRS